jgi:hypothetical protein
MTGDIAELAALVRDQMAEIDRLRRVEVQAERIRAENDRLKEQIDSVIAWIAGDGDALARLQAIYADPRQNIGNIIKALGLALPFERSKPASVMIVEENWMEKTRRIRLAAMERRRAEWALEDQSKIIEVAPEGNEPAA